MFCILPSILSVSHCFEFHFLTQWSHRKSFHTPLSIGRQSLNTLLLEAREKVTFCVRDKKGCGGFSPPQLSRLARSAPGCRSSPELLTLTSKKQAARWQVAKQIFSRDQERSTGLNWLSPRWEPKFLSFSP